MAVLSVEMRRQEYEGVTGIVRATDVARWLIDGETVADFVARTTSAQADDYRPDLRAATVLAPNANMLGQPGRAWHFYTGEPTEGIVPLLICSCGEAGCMSLIADIVVEERTVAWRRIRHATAANHPGQAWDGPPPPDVVFDREQYERELDRFTSDEHANGDPPLTPEELMLLRERFARRRRRSEGSP